MQAPTPGRIVYFKPDPVNNPTITYAAIVCQALAPDVVNLSVFDTEGGNFPRTGVTFVQDGQQPPEAPYAHWMPYQVARHAELAAQDEQAVTENAPAPAPEPEPAAPPAQEPVAKASTKGGAA